MASDINHPWFRPLWARVLMVAICAGLAGWDLYHGNTGWALIFGGLGAYAVYVFFIAWKDQPDQTDDTDTPE